MKKELSLHEHQEVLCSILYAVDDFCKEHNIQYFLIGGTLLGAVRHHGFIPWDDDVDIAMTRDNYNRFIDIFKKNKPKGLDLLSFSDLHWYDAPFVKVVKNNSYMETTHFYNEVMPIFIDVLPIDGCGPFDKESAVDYYKANNSRILWLCEVFSRNPIVTLSHWKSRILYYTVIYPLLHIPSLKKFILGYFYNKAKHYTITESNYCACIVNGLYGEGEVMPVSFVNELTALPFGDRMLPVPSHWNEYLMGVYGDYMTPPPVEKRKKHSAEPSYLLFP